MNVASAVELITASQPPATAASQSAASPQLTFQASLLAAQGSSMTPIAVSDSRRPAKTDPEEKKPQDVSTAPATGQMPQLLPQERQPWLLSTPDLHPSGISTKALAHAEEVPFTPTPKAAEQVLASSATSGTPEALPLSADRASDKTTPTTAKATANKPQTGAASPIAAQTLPQTTVVVANLPAQLPAAQIPISSPEINAAVPTVMVQNLPSVADSLKSVPGKTTSFVEQVQPWIQDAVPVKGPATAANLTAVPASHGPATTSGLPEAAPPADVSANPMAPVKQGSSAPNPAKPEISAQRLPIATKQEIAAPSAPQGPDSAAPQPGPLSDNSVIQFVPFIVPAGVAAVTPAKTAGTPAIAKSLTGSIADAKGQTTMDTPGPIAAKQTVHAAAGMGAAQSDAQDNSQQNGQTQVGPSPHGSTDAPLPSSTANQPIAFTDHASAGSALSPAQPSPTSAGSGAHSATNVTIPVAVPVHQVPEINNARLIQSVSQSEMRVGLRSSEFGDISIRTTATRDVVSAQISLEHDELARTLVTHLPEIQAKLGGAQPMEVRIDMNGQAAGQQSGQGQGNGTAGGTADGSTAGSQTGQPSRAGGGSAAHTAEPRSSAVTTAGVSAYDAGHRLDITA